MNLNFKSKIKLFSILFVVCFLGIIVSTVLIDRQIDSYISEMKTNVDINIEVIDNNDSNVEIVQDGEDITVYINPSGSEEANIIEGFYVTIIAKSGLNIRQEPTVNSDKVGAYDYGEEVKIIEDYGDWYKTERGFIYKMYTDKK